MDENGHYFKPVGKQSQNCWKARKEINASNNFQAFKLLFRIFSTFQGVKDSPAIPGPSCWIRGIRRKPTKNSPSDPISPFKEVLVLTNPPKSKGSSCHVSCGRAIHEEIPCRIFGRHERAARLFFLSPGVSPMVLIGFGGQNTKDWTLVPTF